MIKFQQEDAFLIEINQKVCDYFEKNKLQKTANWNMKLKLFFLYSATICLYALIFRKGNSFSMLLFIAFIYGIFTFLLAFNVVHDAGHNALFSNKKLNSIFTYTLDLFGVSSFVWKHTHHFHHHSPNVLNHDSLVDDFKLGRIVPYSPRRKMFKYQHIYIPILSLFYSVSLVIYSDFVKFHSIASKLNLSSFERRFEYSKILISKLFTILSIVVIPLVVLELTSLQVILLFFTIHLGPGIIVGFFVAPAHFNTHLSFPIPDSNGKIETTWSEHQLLTTEDFSTNNILLNFSLGGFNHHVAHHLFPGICHIHYPKITPIIQQTANEFKLKYHNRSFVEIYISHLKHLKNLTKNQTT